MSKESISRVEAARVTQESVLHAAVDLFVGQGYKATSVEQISDAAGVAKGTIYIYYKSKKALFQAACQTTVDQFVGQLDELLAKDWACQRDCLEAVLMSKFVYFHDLVAGFPHSLDLLQTGRQLSKEIYEAGDRAFLERVTVATARALEAGEFDASQYGETASSLAELLIAACHGVTESLPAAEYQGQLRRMIAALLRGYAVRQEPGRLPG